MSILLLLVALGGICFLLWNSAIYVVPVGIGFWVGYHAIGWGAGIGCVPIGLVAGAAVYAAAQGVLMYVRWLPLRFMVLAIFAIPAGLAGYDTVMQFAELGLVPSLMWRHVFAVVAAIIVGCTAWVRLRATLIETHMSSAQP